MVSFESHIMFKDYDNRFIAVSFLLPNGVMYRFAKRVYERKSLVLWINGKT
jgi:hypothetical protein